jgi:hypothetical protein
LARLTLQDGSPPQSARWRTGRSEGKIADKFSVSEIL